MSAVLDDQKMQIIERTGVSSELQVCVSRCKCVQASVHGAGFKRQDGVLGVGAIIHLCVHHPPVSVCAVEGFLSVPFQLS